VTSHWQRWAKSWRRMGGGGWGFYREKEGEKRKG